MLTQGFYGTCRHLNVAEDNDLGGSDDKEKEDIVPGLNCKVVVRFESYKDFCNALKALSGRSLQKVIFFFRIIKWIL